MGIAALIAISVIMTLIGAVVAIILCEAARSTRIESIMYWIGGEDDESS